MKQTTAEAILATLVSPNVPDSNDEPANVVDMLHRSAMALERLSRAIMPHASAGKDAAGGRVESLIEAAMGMTAGLCKIAEAITDVADAMREAKQ